MRNWQAEAQRIKQDVERLVRTYEKARGRPAAAPIPDEPEEATGPASRRDAKRIASLKKALILVVNEL